MHFIIFQGFEVSLNLEIIKSVQTETRNRTVKESKRCYWRLTIKENRCLIFNHHPHLFPLTALRYCNSDPAIALTMIICSVSLVLPWLLFLLVTVQLFLSQNTYGFAIINRNNNNIRTRTRTSHADRICNTSFKAAAKEEEDSLSSSKSDLLLLFPVLSKIAGIQWEGTCRYVNSDLIPQKFLKLHGGIQFSIDTNTEGVNSSIALQLQLQSYIVFPNGKRRDIQMRYVHSTIIHQTTE